MRLPAGEIRSSAAALGAAARRRWSIGLRAMLCIGIPLAVGAAAGDPGAGAAASFGGLAGLYVPQAPYRHRARVVGGVGVGLVVAVALGGLAAPYGWLAAVVAGAVAGIASLVCQAVEVPPPRELMLVMAVLAATEVSVGGPSVGERAGLAAAGALTAWLVTMSPAVIGRGRSPEHQAVSAAVLGVATVLDTAGRPGSPSARVAAVNGVRTARAAVARGGRRHDPLGQAVTAVETLLEAALHVEVEATAPLDPGWGAAVRALARAVGTDGLGPIELPPADSAAGGVRLTRAIEGVREALVGAPDAPVPAVDRPRLRAQPVAARAQRSDIVTSAARIALAVAASVGLGQALGLGHAYWVGLTAAAVLQGTNFTTTRRRVVQRVVGTAIGVALAFALLGWSPPVWAVVLIAAAAQGIVELVISTHYGVAVVAITVLALALFHIASGGAEVSASIGPRLVDTAIGAALALTLRRWLWPRATSRLLPHVQSEAVSAVGRLLGSAWSEPSDSRTVVDRRRVVQDAAAVMHAVHADALADAGTAADVAASRWPLTAAIDQLAVLALSRPPQRGAPPAAVSRAFLQYVDLLADGVERGTPVRSAAPALPGYPRTTETAAAVAAALRDAVVARTAGDEPRRHS